MKKKIISLICALLIISLLFCGCDLAVNEPIDANDNDKESSESKQTEKPTEKNEENKKPEDDQNKKPEDEQNKEPENEQNKEPEKVESINGKSASQIVEKFFEDYSSAKSFDMIINDCTVIDDEPYEMHMELKISGDDIYMLMSEDGFDMEIWGVDGMLYIDNDGEKLKTQADINDYFGEEFVEMLVGNMPTELHRIYKNKLDAAEVTFNGMSYSFTVTFSYEEALEMAEDKETEEEVCGFSETYVVASDGTVKAILSDYENGSSSSVELNSYGKSVKISAPINPDDFEEVEIDDGGDYGEIDPEAYELYVEACEVLASANKFCVEYSQDESPVASYINDGENRYIMHHRNNYEAWVVDGRAYARTGGGFTTVDEEPTDYFELAYFGPTEDALPDAYRVADTEYMTYMYAYEDDYGNTIIEFEISRGGNFFDEWYTFMISDDMERAIEVSIWYFAGEEFMGEVNYWFTNINDPDLEVIAPF